MKFAPLSLNETIFIMAVTILFPFFIDWYPICEDREPEQIGYQLTKKGNMVAAIFGLKCPTQ